MTVLTDIGSIEKIKEEVPWAADRMDDAYLIATITEHMPAIETHLEKIEILNGQLLEAQASGNVKSVLDNIQKEENHLNKEYLVLKERFFRRHLAEAPVQAVSLYR